MTNQHLPTITAQLVAVVGRQKRMQCVSLDSARKATTQEKNIKSLQRMFFNDIAKLLSGKDPERKEIDVAHHVLNYAVRVTNK